MSISTFFTRRFCKRNSNCRFYTTESDSSLDLSVANLFSELESSPEMRGSLDELLVSIYITNQLYDTENALGTKIINALHTYIAKNKGLFKDKDVVIKPYIVTVPSKEMDATTAKSAVKSNTLFKYRLPKEELSTWNTICEQANGLKKIIATSIKQGEMTTNRVIFRISQTVDDVVSELQKLVTTNKAIQDNPALLNKKIHPSNELTKFRGLIHLLFKKLETRLLYKSIVMRSFGILSINKIALPEDKTHVIFIDNSLTIENINVAVEEKKPEVNEEIQELRRELNEKTKYILSLEKQQKIYGPMIDMYKDSKNEDWYKLFKEELEKSTNEIKRLERVNARLTKEVEELRESEEESFENLLELGKLTQEQKSELAGKTEAIKQQHMSMSKSAEVIEELETRLNQAKEKSTVVYAPAPSDAVLETRIKLEVEGRTDKLQREKEALKQAHDQMKIDYDQYKANSYQVVTSRDNTIERLKEQLEGQSRLITASLSESNQLKELNKEKHRLEDEVLTYAEAQALIPHMIARIRWLEQVANIASRDMDESDLRRDFYAQNELMFRLIESVTKLVDNYPTNRSNLLQLTSQTLHTLKELKDNQVEKTSYDNQVTLKQVELDQKKAEDLSNSVMYELRQLHDSLDSLKAELTKMSDYIQGGDKAILHTLKQYESVRDLMMYREVTEESERVHKQLKFKLLDNAFVNFEKEIPKEPRDLYTHHKGEAISKKVDRLARGNLQGIPDNTATGNAKAQHKPVDKGNSKPTSKGMALTTDNPRTHKPVGNTAKSPFEPMDLPKSSSSDNPITKKPVNSGLIQAHTRSHNVQVKSFQKLFTPFHFDVKAYNHIQDIRKGSGVKLITHVEDSV